MSLITFDIGYSFEDPIVEQAYMEIEQHSLGTLNTAYHWVSTWWKVFKNADAFGYDKHLYIIRVIRDGKNAAVLPLIKHDRILDRGLGRFMRPFSVLRICGDQWGPTFEDVMGNLSQKETDELLGFIRHKFSYDLLYFSHVIHTSTLFKSIKYNVLLSACPTIRLSDKDNMDKYIEQVYSKKLRQNLRTARNHANHEGKVISYDVISSKTFDWELIRRLSASKLNDDKHSIYLNQDKCNFVVEVQKKIPSNLVVVKCDGQVVAYRLNFLHNGNKYCFDASYDRGYHAYQVGIMSLDASLQETFHEHRLVHCEGTGMDEYKLKFLKNAIPIYVGIEPGNTFLGRLIFYWKLRKMRKGEKLCKQGLQNMIRKYKLSMRLEDT